MHVSDCHQCFCTSMPVAEKLTTSPTVRMTQTCNPEFQLATLCLVLNLHLKQGPCPKNNESLSHDVLHFWPVRCKPTFCFSDSLAFSNTQDVTILLLILSHFRPTTRNHWRTALPHQGSPFMECAMPLFLGVGGRRQPLNRATPSGCRRRPWPWLCHGADASAADPASLDLRFSKGPSRTPFQDHSKIDMGFGSESQRHGGIFEAFLGSPRPLKMCIMSTNRFEN